MRTVTLRDGTKVDVPHNVGRADIKRLAKQLVAQRRPAPKPPVRKAEPEVIPPPRGGADYVSAHIQMLSQEVRALRSAVAAMQPAPVPDPTPALRQVVQAVENSADRVIDAFNAPVSVIRDANGRPVGIKRGS